MADPSSYRPRPGTIPEEPGVYRFRDDRGRVVYVGKAKSLRQRLASYFADPAGLHSRTRAMVWAAASVEWTVVATEVEALQLEYAWIKEFDPRFNVKYRDDKSYPFLAVTVGDEIPRVQVMRGVKRKGVKYFGPYAHAWAIRETLDQLLRVFPVRSCSNGVFTRAGQIGRPCLLGYIDKCSAPCVGRVSADEHRAYVDDLVTFMSTDPGRFMRALDARMREASAAQEYERAATLRDDLQALERALERSAMVLPDDTDADVVAIVDDELEAAVQVFHVRAGRVRGQRGWVAEKVDDSDRSALVEQFLGHLYGTGPGAVGAEVPREVLVPSMPSDAHAVTEWLSTLRGGRVDLRVPQRGDKHTLMSTVAANATHSLALHKIRRAGDLTTRSQALTELQDALELPEAPLRIECYDVSNLQGTEVVASMVVFEDGLPRKSEYRRFAIKQTDGQDDVAAMHEVISRRFRRYLEQPTGSPDEPDRRRSGFAYPPQLVVVDGGPPQVAAAQRAMTELGVVDIAVVGLAKRLEEVWLPDDDAPVILSRTSQALYLLQRVRDEAHRFAIAFHRKRRSAAMTASELDAVPGLGATRRKALLARFGSLRRLRDASVEEIATVPGIGPKTASAVHSALRSATASPRSVNVTTGEIGP